MLDLLIEGAQVADGTGADLVVRPVGVSEGRLRLGDDLAGSAARRRLDGSGLVLAPGFVDVHTHYDAQVFWDPFLTPSSLQGVTTVVVGNCGFSIAPLTEASGDYLRPMLARVEGIPLSALEEGVPWSWRSFADYLAAVAGVGPALNFGAMVGHSALRRQVLGEESHRPDPDADAVAAMAAGVSEAVAAGALGFSSSWGDAHFDGDGQWVPSRHAGHEELVELCRALAPFPGTQVEFIPTIGSFQQKHLDVMTAMALAADSPLNWNVLFPTDPENCGAKLSASDHAASRGARVAALSYPGPLQTRMSFLTSAFDSIPGWSEVLARSPEEISRCLADPAERKRLKELAQGRSPTTMATRFDELSVADTYSAAALPYQGRQLGEIAAEQGREVLDVLFDLAAADLRTGFSRPPIGDDEVAWKLRLATWSDPRVVIGASDAGAHVDILSTFDYPAALFALARQHQVLSVPEVVRLLTDVPASLYGLGELGRIAEGYRADLVLFDPLAIAPGTAGWRNDLPSGAGRLYGEPSGIERVIVNGTEIAAGGKLTGERPGRVLRSGADTGLAA